MITYNITNHEEYLEAIKNCPNLLYDLLIHLSKSKGIEGVAFETTIEEGDYQLIFRYV